MAAGAAIAAGVIGAAGNIGGGLLAGSNDPKPGPVFLGAPEVDLSPGLKIAEFMNLIDQGIFDPTTFKLASPLNQFISEVLSSSNFSQAKKQAFISTVRASLLQQAEADRLPEWTAEFFEQIDAVLIGTLTPKQSRRLIEKIIASSPYSSIVEMFTAERDYNNQIAPLLESAKRAAEGNFDARLDLQGQVRGLLGGLPDASAEGIASLRAEEKSRLLRDLNLNIDEQRSDVLTLANSGNFNPGRPIGDLEEFRARATQDADLEALNRALAIIGGQQQAVGGNLALLQGGQTQTFNEALALAQADQGFRSGVGTVTPTIPANNSLPDAIAAGTSAISQSIFDAIELNTD